VTNSAPKLVKNLLQIENPGCKSANLALSAFSQQVLLQNPSFKSTQVEASGIGKAECTKKHFNKVAMVPNGDSLREDTRSNIDNLVGSSARFIADTGLREGCRF
jgi:hypothetical protein